MTRALVTSAFLLVSLLVLWGAFQQTQAREIAWDTLYAVEHAIWIWQGARARSRPTSCSASPRGRRGRSRP